MKTEQGFSLIEVLISTTIVVLVMGATLATFNTALTTTQAITLMADTQENLRAGMNYMVRDFLQAGEGVPQGGITIPSTSGTSAVNLPGPGTPPGGKFGTFNTSWTALPAITPGPGTGPATSTSGGGTDMVTILYADTTLQDKYGHWLNEFPIKYPPTGAATTPGCAAGNANPQPQGSIVTSGSGTTLTTTITFDTSCILIAGTNTSINPGDLILLQNNNTIGDGSPTGSDTSITDTSGSMALLYVSSVDTAGPNSITFSSGDPFNLNASSATAGTIAQIQTPQGSGTYPTTTATRYWMITYFINNANPQQPELMRQVNMNQPQAVGEVIENLNIFYDIVATTATPITINPHVENPTTSQLPQIVDAYIVLYARSQDPFNHTNRYFRNNLTTAVSIRALDFANPFPNPF